MKTPEIFKRLKDRLLSLTPFGIGSVLAVVFLLGTGILFVRANLNPYETTGLMQFRDAVSRTPMWERLPIPLSKPWSHEARVADFCRTYLEGSASLRRFFPGPARLSDIRQVGGEWLILLKTSGETPISPESASILATDLTASLARGPLSGQRIRVSLNGEFIPLI